VQPPPGAQGAPVGAVPHDVRADVCVPRLCAGGGKASLVVNGDNEAAYRAEIAGARKALAAVVAMLESCNDRIVPIGWDRTAWEGFCLHRYNAADDVRAMKPEDILTER
jgi:hypothetical protein